MKTYLVSILDNRHKPYRTSMAVSANSRSEAEIICQQMNYGCKGAFALEEIEFVDEELAKAVKEKCRS